MILYKGWLRDLYRDPLTKDEIKSMNVIDVSKRWIYKTFIRLITDSEDWASEVTDNVLNTYVIRNDKAFIIRKETVSDTFPETQRDFYKADIIRIRSDGAMRRAPEKEMEYKHRFEAYKELIQNLPKTRS